MAEGPEPLPEQEADIFFVVGDEDGKRIRRHGKSAMIRGEGRRATQNFSRAFSWAHLGHLLTSVPAGAE